VILGFFIVNITISKTFYSFYKQKGLLRTTTQIWNSKCFSIQL